MKKTFKVATLGCRTNQYESEAYRRQFLEMGYAEARDGEQADVCVVNTCTVTASADAHSRHEVRQLVRQKPHAKVVVTGCSAEQHPEMFRQIAGVSEVVPNKEKEKLLHKLFPNIEELPEFSIQNFDSHTRAFVKVQDGCNSFCTYCIIPYVRGRSRSRTLSEIIREVESLVANGYKEIVLTGINIGDFDGNKGKEEHPDRLADLVRAVDKVSDVERIRISSIDPDEVDDDLIDAVVNGRKTCHSMHIVLQSGSNVILKRMNRKYTRQVFLDTIDRLRIASPDFTFTTDVIVGFPGETEADFTETLDVMRDVKFAKVHMFPYSERPRTRAALMPNKIPLEVIRKRKQEVLRFSEQMAFELRDGFVGRTMPVLMENIDSFRPGEIGGHTENFLMVWVDQGDLKPNDLVEVELVENTPSGLIGRVVGQVTQKVS